MRGHFVGYLDFNRLVGTRIMEVEHDGQVEKGVFVPIKDNDIVMWKDELQYWFRSFTYRNPTSRFSHFMMKFIPRKTIKKLSASQIEAFAKYNVGRIIRVDNKPEEEEEEKKDESEILTEDFIQQNI